MDTPAFGRREVLASLLLGWAGFAGTFAPFNFQMGSHELSIYWSMLFPLWAAYGYGARGALVAAGPGLAGLFPVLLWPHYGWAALVNAGQAVGWLVLTGWAADRRRARAAWWNEPHFAQLVIGLAYVATLATLFAGVLALNPAPGAPAARTALPPEILWASCVKSYISLLLLVVLAVATLSLPALRRLLSLPPGGHGPRSYAAFGAGAGIAFLFWTAHAAIDSLVAGRPFVAGLVNPDFPQLVPRVLALILVVGAAGLLARYIAHRDEVLAALDERTAELAAKSRELERMVYVTSHDVRTPLVTIQGFAALVEADALRLAAAAEAGAPPPAGSGDRLRRHIGHMREGVDRISQLVDALLKVSRSGGQPLAPAACDAGTAVGQALACAAYQVRETQAATEVGALPPCLADREALVQVFANLLDNALKYRSPDRRPVVRFSGETRGARVVYAVEDNGVGIAPEDLGRIFEVFERGASRAVTPGEGIGLALVRRLLERMGGSIEVRSVQGAGSVFLVALPAAGAVP